ncbi:Uncharacterised protein [Mycobacteroides abscessus subsp. abscessus]|uniref:Tail assembly chaperone n=1 Tax=Mycobacteroides abscessus subsp. abscessus TaxID=1185650 RepID=A0AB38D0I4_9MYCO|nr:hypothetical protein [Mycobacteroides abscessus]QSM02893.1 tail assembly chaperone [Mycobacterium phage prophi58-1]MBN7468671.1 hypothetical protein [Mycobacteroides abscessus subsp. massiliense]SHW43571.1 Uncharacterised protein [Mycobacteroides abscessus subsp. abscessus]SIA25139.1 Uncharacterised protein [Mycobacteroides abscessus subsp. abscessus]SIB01782.1 Uncharacterised protein [Mycobacteroides abscessus subsp. abscessus]
MANNTRTKSAETADDQTDPDKAIVDLVWEGLKFTIPKRRGRWPVSALRDFARGRNYEAVVTLLGGEEQWQQLVEKCPTGDDFDKFVDYVRDVVKKECTL